jgi:hypothetical protein
MSYKLILERWSRYLNEQVGKKKIYVLVGPPSVGKSTWIQNTFSEQDPYIISRDDLVDQVAEEYGLTYDDLFVAPPPDAKEGDSDEKYGNVVKSPSFMTWQPLSYDKILQANGKVQSLFTKRVASAVPSGQDIVVDMTNMNAGARKSALNAIKGSEQDYEKIAVVFKFEGAEDLIKAVAQKRAEAAKRAGKSKTIPPAAFDRMFKAFQQVSKDEGFDQIVSVDNTEVLSQIANS